MKPNVVSDTITVTQNLRSVLHTLFYFLLPFYPFVLLKPGTVAALRQQQKFKNVWDKFLQSHSIILKNCRLTGLLQNQILDLRRRKKKYLQLYSEPPFLPINILL